MPPAMDGLAARDLRHPTTLAPAKIVRERAQSSRSERIGDGTPAAGPITSPPVGEDDPSGRVVD